MNGLLRPVVAEFTGTAGLLAIVVGSGIMGERMYPGSAGGALLANSLATAAGLFVLVTSFAPVSGAHFNPLISLWRAFEGRLRPAHCATYLAAQIAGAIGGVMLAHAMFALPLVRLGNHLRDTRGEILAEVVATFGLVAAIGLARDRPAPVVAALVACYIGAAYWFTASTSFANPAVTLARSLTDTFSGIAPSSIAGFVVAQVAGAGLGILFVRFLSPVVDGR